MLKADALVAGATSATLSVAMMAAVATPTFTRDVAPLLYSRCVTCHQPSGDAPFSLVTYDQVRQRARQIADVTAKRYMPPWKPEPDSPRFLGERRLRDDEIALIQRWVEGGVPEGPPADLPAPPPPAGGWLSGEPDLVLALPTFMLHAGGGDVFRNFVVAVPEGAPRYVRGLQFRPRSRAVHHANIRIDPTPASRSLDEADPAPGYEGVILHSADFPDGHFLGWTPGQAAPPVTDLAWRLDGGTFFVVQLHMRPTGRVEEIAPLIGLYVTNEPPRRQPAMIRLGRQNLDIPPGAPDYHVSDTFVLPVEAQVMAIQPHAHYRARDIAVWATPLATPKLGSEPSRAKAGAAPKPGGEADRAKAGALLHIADWDFNWQDQYRFAEPPWLPAGTTLEMKYSFDNSSANVRNPSNPPERVLWGWRSSDEMADVWIQVLTRNERDRDTLTVAARRKMTSEDAVGAEVLVAREPNHVNLRNDAALIYQELGRPERALVHFAAVTRLEPRSPAAHYNEGVALAALGRRDEATARYAEAIRLDPAYALAHTGLGNLLYASRRVDEAISEYRAALRFGAIDVNVRCSLARALTETGRPYEAVIEYRAALAERPDWMPCLINFAWLLSSHSDAAIRVPAEAVQLAERAAALTRRESGDALDVLAAAYAAAGRFDAAVETATAALRLFDQAHANRLADDVRERLDLYRRRMPFIVRN